MSRGTDFYDAGTRFADIQMLRYDVPAFSQLSLRRKKLAYCLSEATLWGRDITFDQFGAYNLDIRQMLEAVFLSPDTDHESDDATAMHEYLRRVWFSNGIHHHYGSDKFSPRFSRQWLRDQLPLADPRRLPLRPGETLRQMEQRLLPVVFDPSVMPKRVNKADGEDLVLTSSENYYQGVSQAEVEQFYNRLKRQAGSHAPSFGLNSTLVSVGGQVSEQVWCLGGCYGRTIRHIVYWLGQALRYADNERQRQVIILLISYYTTGDLALFDQYSISWVEERESPVDFINGFIEVYGDPLGLKGSWEGIVELRDEQATRRTRLIADNAQWFEDHSPVDPRFRKQVVRGVSANVVMALMLGGDEYPSSAIGINLPNADWIRAEHGSKSVTISNLTHAYDEAARGNGFTREFVIDDATRQLIDRWSDQTDNLHTDLHECLGHGSGQLLPGVDADALSSYGNTIEEARADLFGLYYIADPKLQELGLLDSPEAYKAQYYEYMMNGLLTQLVRIEPGRSIEEAHMRNRALIARWTLQQARQDGSHAVELTTVDGKTYVRVNDYPHLRGLFGRLLAEVQRIKSEGDREAARQLVEQYAIHVDPRLHNEVRQRYAALGIAPYKGFVNPVLQKVYDADGQWADVAISYDESYDHQMLRYSQDYSDRNER